MEQYDEYVFLQSQPQLYKYIKEDCPELYEKIKERIAESRWESDGGSGVNRDMLEYRRAMDKLPGLPNVKQTRAGYFFKKMHSNVDDTDRYVHTWDGELYLEYHRETYTTQGYNKKMNRYMENMLAQIEWLSSVAYILGGEYAEQQLHDAWECVLLHQFHDCLLQFFERKIKCNGGRRREKDSAFNPDLD